MSKPMTVGELRENLAGFDADLPLLVSINQPYPLYLPSKCDLIPRTTAEEGIALLEIGFKR